MACGLMDKALVFGTKDCRFESCQGHIYGPEREMLLDVRVVRAEALPLGARPQPRPASNDRANPGPGDLECQGTCGLVAMTSASHAEGRQFDPGQVYAS